MKVESVMQTEVVRVNENDSMSEGLKKIKDHKIKHLPVVDTSGALVGIVTDRDLKRASASDATTLEIHELLYLLDKVRMKEIMTRNPVTVEPETGLAEAAGLMVERAVGCAPVVRENKMVGMLTRTDLLRYMARHEQ